VVAHGVVQVGMSKTAPMPAGLFVTHTAGAIHFDGVKGRRRHRTDPRYGTGTYGQRPSEVTGATITHIARVRLLPRPRFLRGRLAMSGL